MKEILERYVRFEIIVVTALLHIGLLLIAEFYYRRYQFNFSYIYAIASCIVLIMIFWMHEFLMGIRRENTELIMDVYI